MDMYSKNGDKGMTSFVHTPNISKADDRIRMIGKIEELSSRLELLENMSESEEINNILTEIEKTIQLVIEGVKDPYNRQYRLTSEMTEILEKEIERMKAEDHASFSGKKKSRIALEISVVRAIARQAESALAAVSVKYGADMEAKRYMNRLSDYLLHLENYIEIKELGDKPKMTEYQQKKENSHTQIENNTNLDEMMKHIRVQCKLTLTTAKYLIERIEKEAERRGKKAVIAICGSDGNPIAVHVMDGAFLVSFDVAIKKAYTSVAVQMPTIELKELTQPGGTFYGLDKMQGGNIIIFGGGVPIKLGETIIGGLGISGGTGEEDHSLAEYGLSVFKNLGI